MTGPLNRSTPYNISILAVRKDGTVGLMAQQLFTLSEETKSKDDEYEPFLVFSQQNVVLKKSLDRRKFFSTPETLYTFDEV